MSPSQRLAEIIAEAEKAWRGLPAHFHEAGAAWTRADPHVVAHELRRVAERRPRFLEWGSGVGTHCLIADALGMEAHGIEIDGVLVEAARRLGSSLNAQAIFAEGSFLPADRELPPADEDAGGLLLRGGSDGYVELARQLGVPSKSTTLTATYDVIYAYPAPQHVDWFADLFRDVARVGAVFWCYTETAGVLSSTKTAAGVISPLRPA